MILGGKESPTPDQHTLTNIPILAYIIYKPLRGLYIITLRSGGYLAKSRVLKSGKFCERRRKYRVLAEYEQNLKKLDSAHILGTFCIFCPYFGHVLDRFWIV